LHGYATGATGDHRCALPQRLGDHKPKALANRLLHDDLGEALKGVDLDIADTGQVGVEVNQRIFSGVL
jgi:hypothetical protein